MATVLKSILLCALLLTAFWIRVQGREGIPDRQFTGTDAYLYYWQSQIVSEHGKLPARDMYRWLPFGRDLRQTLNFYSYVLAYTHKVCAVVFPNISLYQVNLYTPPVCFILGLGVLCLFFYHTYGFLFASIVGVLLATLPGTIDRSTAGFSDRDSWCLMLGILAVITYLVSLQTQQPRRKILWTLASGGTVFLGGISWEGFGVFGSIILCVEIWRFLSTDSEEGLGLYLIWTLMFVPTLYLASPAYRGGHGFATHLFAFMLVPPVFLFGIRSLRYILLTKFPLIDIFRQHARSFALGLTLVGIVIALSYVGRQSDTFAGTTVPLGQNRLMDALGELKAPTYEHWRFRYGSVFILGSLGSLVGMLRFWEKQGIILTIPIALFCITTFFSESLSSVYGTSLDNIIFSLSIAGYIIAFLFVASQRNEQPQNELITVAMTIWFLIWGALARDAIRYDFFIGVSLAFFTAEFLRFLSNAIRKKVTQYLKVTQYVSQPLLKAGISALMLALILFWTPTGGHANYAILAATQMRSAKPGNTPITEAFEWMRAKLPATAVVAARWEYGSQLNVLGNVKTITDQDHFIQYWIHLYYRYVLYTQDERVALEFLKTHGATHIMFTEEEIISDAPVTSLIGSTASIDLQFEFTPLLLMSTEKKVVGIPTKQTDFFKHIFFDIQPQTCTLRAATITLQNDETINIPWVVFYDKTRVHSKNTVGVKTGGVIIYFDEHQKFQKGYYVPPIAWNQFATRLFLRGISSSAFLPVYTKGKKGETDVKIWEIHYPTDIQPNPKYLKTGIHEIQAQLKVSE